MHKMSIYQTINRPVTISEKQFNTVLDSFRKESIHKNVFYHNDAMACLWQSLSQRIADEIEANMELSESAEEIANVIISAHSELDVERIWDNVYEISSGKTGAKTWLVEKESGEIFLFFLPTWKESELMSARERLLINNVPSHQFVDITEMGPETATIFIEKVFSSFNDVIATLKSGNPSIIS